MKIQNWKQKLRREKIKNRLNRFTGREPWINENPKHPKLKTETQEGENKKKAKQNLRGNEKKKKNQNIEK